MENKILTRLPRFILYVAFFGNSLLSANVFAQTEKESIIPAAPDAAALGKYAEIPVSNYTGIPNISIPIYEIKEGNISVPIGISYHAGGIKVEEVSSSIGLGWSLNAGGVITRSVQCNDDLRNEKYYTAIERFNSGNQAAKDMICADIQSGLTDTEPDIFFYNFGNYSGKFVLFPDGKYRSIPLNGCRIELDQSAPGERWTVTTPDGTRYIFGRSTDNSRTAIEFTNVVFNRGSNSSANSGASAWYLVEIISATNRKVNFYYYATRYWFQGQFASTEYISRNQDGDVCASRIEETAVTNNIQGVRLKEITFSNGKVTFVPSTSDRRDLPQEKSIEGVRITDEYNKYDNYWRFFQGYFNENSGDIRAFRMRLDSLTEMEGSNHIRKSHVFKYDEPGLPSRISQSMDHWGYFNNAGNTTLIPTYSYTPPFSGFPITYVRADRESNEVVMKAGILTEITYPTGGKTKFEYEANKIVSERIPDPVDEENVVTELVGDEFFDTEFDLGISVEAKIDLQGDIYSYFDNGCILIYLRNTTTGFQYIFGKNFMTLPTTSLILNSGHYIFRFVWTNESGCEFHDDVWMGSNISWKKQNPTQPPPEKYNKVVGGLRIAKITTTEPVSGKEHVKAFSYQKFNAPVESSGSIFSIPSYMSEQQIESTQGHFCDYTLVRSNSNYPLLSPAGSFAEYSEVTVTDISPDGQNLVSQYTYMDSGDWGDVVDEDFPFPPVASYEWMRGFLKKETHVRKMADGNYQKVDETINEYTFHILPSTANPLLPMEVKGLKFGITKFYLQGTYDHVTVAYEVPYGFPFMKASEHTRYTPNGDLLTERKVFDYDNIAHFQLTDVSYTNSKGESRTAKYEYPHELVAAQLDPDGVYAGMIAKNQIGAIATERNFNGTTQISLTKTNYGKYQNAFYLPSSIEEKIGNGSQEQRILFNSYDQYGNTQSMTGTNKTQVSYIWGYNYSLPLAQCTNADVTGIAFTSFEGNTYGNWTLGNVAAITASGITGDKSYNLAAGNLVKSGLQSGQKYIVSYWAKNGTVGVTNTTVSQSGAAVNGWTYTKKVVTGTTSVTISGSAIIDELRLYPEGAQMTSYTYAPLVGMTSQADNADRIIYYEYDKLGRLLRVRDMYGKILKQNDYQYNQSVTQ